MVRQNGKPISGTFHYLHRLIENYKKFAGVFLLPVIDNYGRLVYRSIEADSEKNVLLFMNEESGRNYARQKNLGSRKK